VGGALRVAGAARNAIPAVVVPTTSRTARSAGYRVGRLVLRVAPGGVNPAPHVATPVAVC
jgi:hypothetical protein